MPEIIFNDTFVDTNIQDLQNFIHSLSQEDRFKDARSITISTYLRCDEMGTMTNIEICFVVYNPDDENGTNRCWSWKTYRAKSHSCSNSGFKETTGDYIRKTIKYS